MTSQEINSDDIHDEPMGFSINFNELRSMAYRQRYVMGAIILLSLVVGLIITILSPAIYQSQVKIQIDPDSNNVLDDEAEQQSRIRGSDVQRYLNSQLDLIKSRKMATRVANSLRLSANDNFLTKMNIDDGLTVVGGKSAQRARNNNINAALVENVDIKLPFGSKVATITFDSPDQKLSEDVANSYAENLISGNIQQRFEATSYARDFLEKEISDAKKRLEESEQESILYARDTRIIDASDGVNTDSDSGAPRSITTANLVQMNSNLSKAKTDRILAEQKWLAIRGKPLFAIAEVISNSAIQNLQAEKANKEAEYRELLDRYKGDHPLARQSSSQVSSINAEINSIARNIKQSIRNEYEIAIRQEKSLSSSLEEIKNDTLNEQNKRVQLNLIGRDVDTNRAQYQALLERYKTVITSADVVTNNISIIDRAVLGQQIAPRPLINILLAGFIGVALALFAAFLRETFDDSIRSPDDVSHKLGLPLLGTTPLHTGDEPVLTMLSDRKSAIAEAYASIRSSLDFTTSTGAPKTLLITSSQPSEGKSTSAIAIADSFGRARKKVLLVDTDLRNPSLHRYMGLTNNDGFIATITGNAEFAKSVGKPKGMHFDFLSCGPTPPNPTEIVTTDSIKRFIQSLDGKYDHIIFDGPPVMGLADSPQISHAVQGTALIVETGRIRGGQTKSAIRRLIDSNANVLGVILSKFDGAANGYGEYYGYSYNYSEKAVK